MSLQSYEIVLIMIFVGIAAGYIITSIVLLKFPTLLHKRKTTKFKAVHISHRGGAGEHLENTMTAFKHAFSLGTDMLEIDCHMTKDGLVVVSHDNDLRRTTGQDDQISDLDYKDLPWLQPWLTLDFQKNHKTLGCSEDRRIPLLREVFQAFPDIAINLDIKIDNDELIRKVSDLITEFDREDLTAWGNKSITIEDKLYKRNPRIPLIFSLHAVLRLVILFYTGLLPFVPLRSSFLEIIMPSILLNSEKFPGAQSRKQRLLFRIVDKLLMRQSLFTHLEKRGIQTNVWVLNDEAEFERAYRLGVTGVMTDFPTKLQQFLEEHPEYKYRN